MLSEAALRQLLLEGKQIRLQDYYDACQTYSAKTFFLFVECLTKRPRGMALSSKILLNYVLDTLKKSGIRIDKKFNPQGWFGNQWTTGVNDNNWSLFRKEYLDILDRNAKSPYYYQIKPAYYDRLKTILISIEQTTHDNLSDKFTPEEDSTLLDVLTEVRREVFATNVSETAITFGLERDLQRFLRTSIEQLEPGLTIIDNGKERSTDTGRIDITGEDSQGSLVVIELKVGQAPDDSLTQILGYMSSLSTQQNKLVRGILVAGGFSPRLSAAAKMISNLKLKTYRVNFQFDSII